MANVTLPTINSAGDDLNTLVKKLLNAYVMLTEELTFLLNNLDTRNINELNAELINAGTINANLVQIKSDLMAGGYIKIDGEGMKINDGTTDTMVVGLDGKPKMTGAEIRSKAGYPAVVMDPDSNLFGAYKDLNNLIKIEADFGGAPGLRFIQGGAIRGNIHTLYGDLTMEGLNGLSLQSAAGRDVNIDVFNGGKIYVSDFDDVYDRQSNISLGYLLGEAATAGASTTPSGGHNHGIPDGTQLRTADGGVVTFYNAPQHTHAQTNI